MIRERRRTEERDLESDDAIRWISINGEKNVSTLNLVKGNNVYGEKLVKYEGEEYGFGILLEASLQLPSKRE